MKDSTFENLKKLRFFKREEGSKIIYSVFADRDRYSAKKFIADLFYNNHYYYSEGIIDEEKIDKFFESYEIINEHLSRHFFSDLAFVNNFKNNQGDILSIIKEDKSISEQQSLLAQRKLSLEDLPTFDLVSAADAAMAAAAAAGAALEANFKQKDMDDILSDSVDFGDNLDNYLVGEGSKESLDIFLPTFDKEGNQRENEPASTFQSIESESIPLRYSPLPESESKRQRNENSSSSR